MHEADFYEKLEGLRVRCNLCSHRCEIAPDRRGTCGVRENRSGTLFSLAYGRLISCAADPIEKKPLHHFLPGTASWSVATVGCNLRCDFCQNWEISQHRPKGELPGLSMTPEEVVEEALDRGCASISYTYTEPTVFFEFARDTARLARQRGLANVFVTNGYQTPETVEAMKGLIDAANVDLKGFTDEFYRTHCGARLQPVLDSIRAMCRAGIHVEVTTLVIPGRNDSSEELRGIARFLAGISPDLPWHVSRFHPDYKATDLDWTPGATIEMAVRIGREAGLRYVYAGNMPSGSSDTVCPGCGKVVVARRGFHSKVVALEPSGRPVEGLAMPPHSTGARCASCARELPVVLPAPG